MTAPKELGTRAGVFMGSQDDYSAASLVLLGAPLDCTTSFRPGTRGGPQSIREVSHSLEEYSVRQDRELSQVSFYDSGDLALPLGNIEKSLDRIQAAVQRIYSDGKFPLIIGGEHLISLPAITAARAFYPDLVVLQLDAHADLRPDYEGERYSHATVMRRISEQVGGKNVYQGGIRSGSKEEFLYASANTNLYRDFTASVLEEILIGVGQRPLYVTLDIDVVDPAFAPGTGTPEPGGISPQELLGAISLLGKAPVVGFDLVEVSPPYDFSE